MAPIENDLTPEELADFQAHGVTFDTPEPAPAPAEPAPEPAPAPAEPAPAAAPTPTTAVPVTPPAETPPADPNALPAPAAPQPAMVPHAALHAERMRAAEAIRQSQLAATRLNALLARTQEQTPAPMPDMEQDPAAYLQALEARVAGFENAQHEAAQQRAMEQALETDERTYALAQPDYEQASAYYVQSRARELLHFYKPDEVQRIMTEEVRSIAQQSWDRNMPAAESIYKLAQARGYTAAAPADPAAAPAPTPPTPQTPAAPAAPTPAAVGAPTPAAAVAAVRAGQGASASLSGVGGTGGAPPLTAEAVLAMSDAEFEAYCKLGTKDANARFAEIGGA